MDRSEQEQFRAIPRSSEDPPQEEPLVTESRTPVARRALVRRAVLWTILFYALTLPVILLQGRARWPQEMLICAQALCIALCVNWLATLYKDPKRRRRARRAARVLLVIISFAVGAIVVKMFLDYALLR